MLMTLSVSNSAVMPMLATTRVRARSDSQRRATAAPSVVSPASLRSPSDRRRVAPVREDASVPVGDIISCQDIGQLARSPHAKDARRQQGSIVPGLGDAGENAM